MEPWVSIRKIDAYDLPLVKEGIRDFLADCSSLRLKKAKTILLKPNLLGKFSPEQAVTTHPVVMEALIQLLLEEGKNVWLGDSPGGAGNVKEVWQATGMQSLAEKYPIQLVNFSSFGVQEFNVGGMHLAVSKVIWEADAVISVSKYKTHGQMAFTGAVKNLFGLVPGMLKTEYHKRFINPEDFGHMLAELYKLVRHRIVYHLMDGIIGMDGAGPSAGRVRKFGLLFGSVSAPALDYLAAKFMGFRLKQINYIGECLQAEGILPSRIRYPLSFQGFKLEDVDHRTAGLRSKLNSYVPNQLRYVADRLVEFHPFITDRCQTCLMCVKSCPVHTIYVGKDGIPYVKPDKCIRCLCCQEVCPYRAIELHKSLLAKLIL
ncbi:MAG TPA: DUF362 domain-containing protein [Candidatus Cloacimonadota bacterium]|nr:DUF362 domain-containing protein [Candidatus Cloacimonadota bacterium]HQL14679.1 DUF362 domain-containing protein [Candidatus Cloacimonadota bacterium]